MKVAVLVSVEPSTVYATTKSAWGAMLAVTVNCAIPPSTTVPVGAMLSTGVSSSATAMETELAVASLA